jgi:hypothetical protein
LSLHQYAIALDLRHRPTLIVITEPKPNKLRLIRVAQPDRGVGRRKDQRRCDVELGKVRDLGRQVLLNGIFDGLILGRTALREEEGSFQHSNIIFFRPRHRRRLRRGWRGSHLGIWYSVGLNGTWQLKPPILPLKQQDRGQDQRESQQQPLHPAGLKK